MNTKEWALFYTLSQKFHPGNNGVLSSFLSDEDTPPAELWKDKEFSNTLFSFEKILATVHYSWFFSFFEKLEPEKASLFLAIIPPDLAEKITAKTKRGASTTSFSPIGKRYITSLFVSAFCQEHNIFPPELLPFTPFDDIHSFAKPQLLHLVDYLGLQELATELATIEHRPLIKSIHSSLQQEKKEYVLAYIEAGNCVSLDPIDIMKWDGDAKKLHLVIHQKGLKRMGAALAGMPQPFIQYVCHRLDTGRGSVIQKYASQHKDQEKNSALQNQMNEVIQHFVNNGGHTS
jgi:hypothetical protein